MKRRFHPFIPFCAAALALCCMAATPSNDENADAVKPTGVPHRSKSKRTHRATVKPRESAEPTEIPTVPGVVPATGASSVIVINAHSGEVLYEKNPDQMRPPASTEKLLTALIIAEGGYLDREVTVEAIDTMAEPVKLNIKPGETYQRIRHRAGDPRRASREGREDPAGAPQAIPDRGGGRERREEAQARHGRARERERNHRVPGADCGVQRDAPRPEVGGAHPRATAARQGRVGGADRDQVRPTDPAGEVANDGTQRERPPAGDRRRGRPRGGAQGRAAGEAAEAGEAGQAAEEGQEGQAGA